MIKKSESFQKKVTGLPTSSYRWVCWAVFAFVENDGNMLSITKRNGFRRFWNYYD